MNSSDPEMVGLFNQLDGYQQLSRKFVQKLHVNYKTRMGYANIR